jgi:7-carboxy-7-deazaguanine synthase
VWCDTPYASWDPEGEQRSVEQILRQVRDYGTKHTVVTGGEPMIMPDVVDLCAALKEACQHVTIETAATVYKPLQLDLASLSPKLSNSTPKQREGGKFAEMHERQRLNCDVIQQFIDTSPDFQLKFVVSNEDDLREIDDILAKVRGWQPSDILLMPEGIDAATLASRASWISDICKRTGYRYCPRLHVELYGNKRGT